MESWSKDVPLDMLREELLEEIQAMTGRNLPEHRAMLKLLAHPDMIKSTLAYFQAMDFDSRCSRYQAPWSCIREAESRYENKQNGWLGASLLDNGFGEWWCENCRQKVIDG